MMKPLDDAIAQLKALPEAEHGWAADNIRSILRTHEQGRGYQLTPEQVEQVQRTLDDLDAGRERLLSEDEADAMWRRLGL